MNVNENLVKKQKNEEEEFEEVEDIEIEEEEKEKQSSSHGSSDDSAKKKLMKMMAFIVAGAVILIFILFILSLFTKKKYEYEDIEEVLATAAESYFKDYPDSLPGEDGDIVEIDSSNLVAAGKMKDLSEYLPEGVA